MVTVTMKKRAMLGQWTLNDLAKSSFAGVTAQVQCYGRIGMSNAATVSDVAINGLLNRDGKKKQISHATTSTKKKKKGQETWIVSWLANGATDYSFDDVHGGCALCK